MSSNISISVNGCRECGTEDAAGSSDTAAAVRVRPPAKTSELGYYDKRSTSELEQEMWKATLNFG